MRITTNMLNESARKAGLPINSMSLLNYVNNGNTENTLLEALNRNKESISSAEKKSAYEKLYKDVNGIMQSTDALLNDDENSLFVQAKASGEYKNVYQTIEKLFDSYNNTLKNLESNPNTMNDFYRHMLIEASADTKKRLVDVGITFSKDGKAVVDIDKVKTSELAELESLFGKESSFVKRVEFLAIRVSDNAEANIKSVGSGYNASGNMNDNMNNSRYEFWG